MFIAEYILHKMSNYNGMLLEAICAFVGRLKVKINNTKYTIENTIALYLSYRNVIKHNTICIN